MPNVVYLSRHRHALAPVGSEADSGKQSSAVTSPSVSALMAAANGADSQDFRFRMRLMCDRSTDTPRARSRSAIASSSSLCSDMNSASCMSPNVYQMHIEVNPLCASVGMENGGGRVHDAHTMVPKLKSKQKSRPQWRPTNLRAWRERAGKTLEEVAPKMGLKHSQLSRVERGHQMYNQRILEVAALEYGCTISDILERTPPKVQEMRRVDVQRRA